MTPAHVVRVMAAMTLIAMPARGQIPTLRPEVTTAIARSTVRPGTSVRATLRMRLPAGVHVQSNTPRDPALIPTKLTVDVPAVVSVDGITYPRASDLKQPGREQPLAVFSGAVAIEARLAIAPDAPAGTLIVPATLRSQGCTERVCFPPAQLRVEWVVTVVHEPGSVR